VATKDTAKEISDAAKEIRDSHAAEGTASAMEETVKTVGETLQVTKDTARQVPKAAPKTTKTVRKGAVQATNRLKGAVRTKGKAKEIKKKEKTRLAKQKRDVRPGGRTERKSARKIS
jgi:hypothetical protein